MTENFTNQSAEMQPTQTQEYQEISAQPQNQPEPNTHSQINPENFYKRETQTTTQSAMPQNPYGEKITALAKAIHDNENLRQEFLKIINPSSAKQTENPQRTNDFQPQAKDFGAQQSVTKCALDLSLAEVESRNPNFFKAVPARAELRNYLKENCPNLPQAEVFKILKLATNLEKQAITCYKNQLEYQKSLKNGNLNAKSKLSTNADFGKMPFSESGKIFTRNEIGNMSLDEYRKNERKIFAQYRNGLIK